MLIFIEMAGICGAEGLPQILLDVAGEGGGLRPAVVVEGAADVGLYLGREGTGAVVVFVVALAGIDADEMAFDSFLDAARHVVIDGGEADGHADGLVPAEEGAVGTLHLRAVEVDAVDKQAVGGHIAGEDAVQAVLTKRTGGAVANGIAVGLCGEDLFAGFSSVGVFHS